MYNTKTWKQAFEEVDAYKIKREIINLIACEITGRQVKSLLELTKEDRELVWNNYYNTTELCG